MNAAVDSRLTALQDAMFSLLKLCKEQQTGSMYMYGEQGQGIIIHINAGEIIDIFCRNLRGKAAMDELKAVSRVKYFFKGSRGSQKQRESNAELSNEEVFKSIGIDYSGAVSTVGLKKIMVVEDSGLARKILVKALADQGYFVTEAKDGQEALDLLAISVPDLVLLDLILPKVDGYEVLARMKQNQELKKVPVIVLTSRDALFDKLKGKMSGTDEYLTKPVSPDQLKIKLDKYLG